MSDAKSIGLPSHLWAALDQMAGEMGVGRDQLIAQAVFTLARLNGYLVPGKVHVASGGPPRLEPSVSRSAAMKSRGRGMEEEEPQEEDVPPDEGMDDLPQDDLPDEGGGEDEPVEEEAPPQRGGGRASLTLFVQGRDPFKMPSDSMTIGRGKSCDFVIESNRVSREHARITREGTDFYFEDLNSSNGSFFGPNKEKVTTRRKLKDGDEYTLGTEKVKFSIRR